MHPAFQIWHLLQTVQDSESEQFSHKNKEVSIYNKKYIALKRDKQGCIVFFLYSKKMKCNRRRYGADMTQIWRWYGGGTSFILQYIQPACPQSLSADKGKVSGYQ